MNPPITMRLPSNGMSSAFIAGSSMISLLIRSRSSFDLYVIHENTTTSSFSSFTLRGKSVTKAGQTVSVDSVTVSPVPGGKLALTVQFEGAARGTLRFVGTPRYDEPRGQIVVPDLDYALDTDNDLVRAIAWIKSDDLRALFRENARVPVAPVLERGKALLTEGLNRRIGKVVTLAATVDSVSVEGLHVTRGGVVVRAGASGKAAVSVRERR